MKTALLICLLLGIVNVILGIAAVSSGHGECKAMLAQSMGTLAFACILYLTYTQEEKKS